MDCQDWNVIILKNKNKPVKDLITEKHKNNVSVITSLKNKKQQNTSSYVVDEEGQVITNNLVPKEIATKIQTIRTSKNLKRKDLAIKLNIKENVITEIETGKYKFDKLLIRKIENVLQEKIL